MYYIYVLILQNRVITTIKENRKLRYYKDVINPNLEDQNYLSVSPSVKKKISIAKIRTNSHEFKEKMWCDNIKVL